MKLAAVIPCFKVEAHIVGVVQGVLGRVDHVFVVDDRCPEASGKLVQATFPNERVTVLFHTENQGVGGATVTGYKAALERGYDVFIKIDGDGQMNPDYIPELVHPILDLEADYTKGNRFYRREYLQKMPVIRLLGNSALSLITKISSGYWNVMDPTNGYTALHATAAREIELDKVARRYFFESDMLFRLNIARAVVKDVPMPAIYGAEESNLRIKAILFEFMAKNLTNFGKRFLYNYIVRDINVGTVQAIIGLALFLFGGIFGVVAWIESAAAARSTPVGTVMIATLPIILGFQLLLAALSFDIANVPTKPIQRILRLERSQATAEAA
jgi:dolichol-phosphate mannosyltransferase